MRAVAPNHLVLLGGIQYSNSLSQWSAYAPERRQHRAGVARVQLQRLQEPSSCWDGAPAALAATLPIVTTELGEDDCGGTFIDPLMQWLDGHGASYLAWSWNQGACVRPRERGQTPGPGRWSRTTAAARPTGGYAQTFHDHLAAIVGGTAPAP